jgi:hypothetical protein
MDGGSNAKNKYQKTYKEANGMPYMRQHVICAAETQQKQKSRAYKALMVLCVPRADGVCGNARNFKQ